MNPSHFLFIHWFIYLFIYKKIGISNPTRIWNAQACPYTAPAGSAPKHMLSASCLFLKFPLQFAEQGWRRPSHTRAQTELATSIQLDTRMVEQWTMLVYISLPTVPLHIPEGHEANYAPPPWDYRAEAALAQVQFRLRQRCSLMHRARSLRQESYRVAKPVLTLWLKFMTEATGKRESVGTRQPKSLEICLIQNPLSTRQKRWCVTLLRGSLQPSVRSLQGTWTVDGPNSHVATISSVGLLGPWARPFSPQCSRGDWRLLSLINCKLL